MDVHASADGHAGVGRPPMCFVLPGVFCKAGQALELMTRLCCAGIGEILRQQQCACVPI